MLLASIRVTFLGWDGSFVGRKRREVWKVGPLCIFGQFGRLGTKLCLKIMCYPSKDLKVLLFIFFGWRRNCS